MRLPHTGMMKAEKAGAEGQRKFTILILHF